MENADLKEQKSAFENTFTYKDLPKETIPIIPPPPGKRRLLYFICILATSAVLLGVGLLYINNAIRLLVPSYAQQNPDPNLPQATVSIQPTITVKKHEIVGFLPSWTVAKNIQVNPKNLTQIVYFAIAVNGDGNLVKQDAGGNMVLEWQYMNSPYFENLKKEAAKTNTKVLIAIKNFDNESIDNLIANRTASSRFNNQIISLIEKYGLDGVNVDFEYFTDSDFPTFKYLNRFLSDLSQSLKSKNSSLLLSIDLNATVVMTDRAYDMVKIGEVVDQVIVMGYDYTRAQSVRAGHVAPLRDGASQHSIDQSITSLEGRVPADKIILALPFYGYEWQTTSTQFQSPTVENTGALASYGRVQELLKSRNDIVLHWDEVAAAPWLMYRQSGAVKQIYYEDERSWAKKLAFIKDRKLLGAGIWALGYEGTDASALWNTITREMNVGQDTQHE